MVLPEAGAGEALATASRPTTLIRPGATHISVNDGIIKKQIMFYLQTLFSKIAKMFFLDFYLLPSLVILSYVNAWLSWQSSSF